MIGALGRFVGYSKAPRATFVARHPVKGFKAWRSSRRGFRPLAVMGVGAAILALPAGLWALRRGRNGGAAADA
jgi:hypothetical protein